MTDDEKINELFRGAHAQYVGEKDRAAMLKLIGWGRAQGHKRVLDEVADKLRVSKPTIERWLEGKNMPQPAILKALQGRELTLLQELEVWKDFLTDGGQDNAVKLLDRAIAQIRHFMWPLTHSESQP